MAFDSVLVKAGRLRLQIPNPEVFISYGYKLQCNTVCHTNAGMCIGLALGPCAESWFGRNFVQSGSRYFERTHTRYTDIPKTEKAHTQFFLVISQPLISFELISSFSVHDSFTEQDTSKHTW